MEYDVLNQIHYSEFTKIFEHYKKDLEGSIYLRTPQVVLPTEEGTAFFFVLRENDIYVTNDMKRNNDWLIGIENRPNDCYKRYVWSCTADPKTRRYDIATFMPQIYTGNLRNHRYVPNRIAICQDNCAVVYGRYRKDGQFVEQVGNIGLHIHNPAGFFNSSLGCVIMANDSDYEGEFKPLLYRIKPKQRDCVPVAVMQSTRFSEWYDYILKQVA